MKHVFTDISTIAHLWANQPKPEMLNASGNKQKIMAKKPKYIGILIRRKTIYLSGSGDQLDKQPDFNEIALDMFNATNKYLLVELWSKVGVVTGNTIRVIQNSAYDLNQVIFDEIYIKK